MNMNILAMKSYHQLSYHVQISCIEKIKKHILLQERQVCNRQFVEILARLSACNVGYLASLHTFSIHKQITTIIHLTGGRSKMTYTGMSINFPSFFTNLFSPPGTTLIPYLTLHQLTVLFLMFFVPFSTLKICLFADLPFGAILK